MHLPARSSTHEPQVVIGYDVTFSAAKSLSIVWATGDAEVRALCEEAFEAGVAKAVEYLESYAIWCVGVGATNPPRDARRVLPA